MSRISKAMPLRMAPSCSLASQKEPSVICCSGASSVPLASEPRPSVTLEGTARTRALRTATTLTCSYVHGPTRTMCRLSELRSEIQGRLRVGMPMRKVDLRSQPCVLYVGEWSVAKTIFNLAATTAAAICFIAGSVSYLRPIRW